MDLQDNKSDGIILPVTNTRISASEYNQIAGSLMHIINTAALTPDAGDNAQLLQAIQALAGGGGGGSVPTLAWYTGQTGTTVTIADTSAATLVKIYKNGILLEPTADYTVSGTTLTLVTPLIATDKITTEVY